AGPRPALRRRLDSDDDPVRERRAAGLRRRRDAERRSRAPARAGRRLGVVPVPGFSLAWASSRGGGGVFEEIEKRQMLLEIVLDRRNTDPGPVLDPGLLEIV